MTSPQERQASKSLSHYRALPGLLFWDTCCSATDIIQVALHCAACTAVVRNELWRDRDPDLISISLQSLLSWGKIIKCKWQMIFTKYPIQNHRSHAIKKSTIFRNHRRRLLQNSGADGSPATSLWRWLSQKLRSDLPFCQILGSMQQARNESSGGHMFTGGLTSSRGLPNRWTVIIPDVIYCWPNAACSFQLYKCP